MKKIILTALAILFIIGCSEDKKYDTPESVIRANLEFFNLEDLDGTMSTVHPESPSYKQTEEIVEELFKIYDINSKYEKLEVVKKNDNEAEVNFVQLTTKIKGPEFKNNRLTGKHLLKKYKNSWKIFSTETINVTYLN